MELSVTRRIKALGTDVKWFMALEPTSIKTKPSAKRTWRHFCVASRPWLVTIHIACKQAFYKKGPLFNQE